MKRLSKVLVTGGAGFIGSHLISDLMSRGVFVKVVDNLSVQSTENIASWLDNPRLEFIRGDLKDPEVAREGVEDVEVVFHLAANSDVKVGNVDPSIHFHENLTVTFNLLEAMRESKNSNFLVFTSSSTVYGEPDEFPTSEDYGPLMPISIYGASKLGCESLISSYCHTFDLAGVILRLANIVGGNATHGILVDFIKKLSLNSRELGILGDGTQTKSYLHVEDFLDAMFLILDSFDESRTLEIYNVGSPDQISVRRIAEIVCEEMGLNTTLFKYDNSLGDGRGWKGDVKVMQLSIKKLSALGWTPSLNSEEAIRKSCKELIK